MKLTLSVVALGLAVLVSLSASAQVAVDGHTRRDGTYVAPHYRSSPDQSYNNNWSVRPNANPYSGERGTRQPTWDDRPPRGGGLYGSPYLGR